MCACDHELLIGYWYNLSQEQCMMPLQSSEKGVPLLGSVVQQGSFKGDHFYTVFITCRNLSHGATTLPLS